MSFYVQSVEAFGPEVKKAKIDFIDGLNIIAGSSNRGKTTVIQCIEYVFGGLGKQKEMSLSPSTTGYNLVKVTLNINGKSVELARNLQNNKYIININSKSNLISSGEYSSLPSKKNLPFIGSVLIKLLGIDSEILVPINSEYKGQRLTLNTLRTLWLLDEDHISASQTVLLPNQGQTAFLAGVLYLLNGDLFPINKNYKSQERREAVKNYIINQITKARRQKKFLTSHTKYSTDLPTRLRQIEENAKKIDTQIADKVNQSKQIYSSMLKLSDQLTECKVALDRYTNLQKQYVADINRLNFIIDGEKAFSKLDVPFLCPVCGQPIPPGQVDHSHLAAAQVELSKITSLLKDVEQAISNLKNQRTKIQNKYKEYEQKRAAIDHELSEKNYPSLRKLQNMEKQYRLEIENQSKINLIDSMVNDWHARIKELDQESVPTEPFKPRGKLGNDFYIKMGEILNDLLNKGNYEGLKKVAFNKGTFDLEINGLPKIKNHGKGYRSYLNSIVFMALNEYINKYGKYKVDLLMIDTPLDGLEEDTNKPTKGMQEGIFNLLIERGKSRQTIIVENLEHLPDIDFNKAGVNVVRYENGKGFLNLDLKA